MKTLHVPRLEVREGEPLEELAARVEAHGVWGSLTELPWPAFPYRPSVRFGIAHTGNALCIVYRVTEQEVLAEKTETNSQVSEDSCVELFIEPGDDGLYYNIEWSCIGTCLVGVGTDRYKRELLSPAVVASIRRVSSLGERPFALRHGGFEWSLTAEIPVSIFTRHRIGDLSGIQARGNLYKCGDRLSAPHYVTWNPVDAPRPDYHRPEQFGRLLFDA